MTTRKGKVKVGDKVPFFTSFDQDGKVFSSETILGKKCILFFYGQDDSPTCTKEACNIRDSYQRFVDQGYHIFGISRDNDKKHRKFIQKYQLPYPLIADTELNIQNAFGYFGPKIFMGKEVNGIYRTTVVTNEAGIITHIIDNVISGDHSNQLIQALGF